MDLEKELREFAIGQKWMIEANAGTGKTYTLENIVAHLISSGIVAPEKILLVTFTVKAAAELRARVRECLRTDLKEKKISSEQREKIESALSLPDALWNIQTIHGFCQNALLEFSLLSKTAPLFQMRSASELGEAVAERALRKSLLKESHPEFLDSVHDYKGFDRRVSEIISAIAGAWSSNVRAALPDGSLPSGARAVFDPSPHSKDNQYTNVANRCVQKALQVLPHEYQKMRDQFGWMTFDSLISDLHRKTCDPVELSVELVSALREKFRICIVDEFQDTDHAQWAIFRKLFCESDHHSFVCVGDPKQSIYGFRGADLEAYRSATGWLRTKGAKSFVLTKNWRSSVAMVETVNKILEDSNFATLNYTHPSVSARPTAGIWQDQAMTKVIPPVKILKVMRLPDEHARNEFVEFFDIESVNDTRYVNPRPTIPFAIAHEIHRLMRDPPWIKVGADTEPRRLRLSDIMVLTAGRQFVKLSNPTGDQVLMVSALNHFKIPYWVYRFEKLFLLSEVSSLLDVLNAALAPEDQQLRNRAMLAPLISGLHAQVWEPVRIPENPERCPVRIAEIFLRELGLLLELRKYNAALGLCLNRLELHQSLSHQCRNNIEVALERLFEAAIVENYSGWQTVELLKSWIAAGNGAEDTGVEGETNTHQIQGQRNVRDAVRIVTWHSAKGLEAPVTFVTGGFKSPPDGDDYTLELRFGRRPHEQHDSANFGATYKNGSGNTDHVIEENKRLQYVVLTRARVLMYLPIEEVDEADSKEAVDDNVEEKLNFSKWHTAMKVISGMHRQGFGFPVVQCYPLSAKDSYPKIRDGILPEDYVAERTIAKRLSENEIGARSGISMSSYTSLKNRISMDSPVADSSDEDLYGAEESSAAGELVAEDVDAPERQGFVSTGMLDGMRGREFGIFVHTLFEDLNWSQLRDGPDSPSFRAEVQRVLDLHEAELLERYAGRQQDIRDAFVMALTTPLVVDGVIHLSKGIWQADKVRCEVDFHLHNLFEQRPGGDRLFCKGFIDVILEHAGRVYFLDWKTDLLEHSQIENSQALSQVMHTRGYDIQLRLYSKAVWRALGGNADTPSAAKAAYDRFGGAVYLFIRYGEQGVYAARPTLDDLRQPLRLENIAGEA